MSVSSVPSVELGAVVERLRASGCVFAEDEAALIVETARDAAEVAAMVDQRVAGLPLEHVLGWASFRGLRIAVDPGVFIPRRRTEFLVAEALEVTAPGAVVVDLGCGSGALGCGDRGRARRCRCTPPTSSWPRFGVPGAIWSRGVGRCIRAICSPRCRIELRGRIDVLLANVPYVPTNEIRLLPPEARLYEPHVTLDGGPDGLATLRRVAAGAPELAGPWWSPVRGDERASGPAGRGPCCGARPRPLAITSDDELGATVVHGIKPGAGRAGGTPAG